MTSADTTTTAPAPLRIGLCQLRMHWQGDDNTAGVVQALHDAAARGARVALFPELALTGMHRQIAAQARPERAAGWLRAVQDACRRHAIAASVGAPAFAADGGIHIAQHFIDAQGDVVGSVLKTGLTAPEATFFRPAQQRPTLALAGRRWSAMLCREVEDSDDVVPTFLRDGPDIVLWPGALRPDPDKPRIEPPHHVRQAQAIAQRCAAFVVMVNWPNALNRPEESADAGHSVVIGPDGGILLTLPQAEAGLALFTLGDTAFDWLPQAAATAAAAA